MAVKAKRASLIYSEDARLPVRKSHDNAAVQRLYADHLGQPLGDRSHRLLHTTYAPRTPLPRGPRYLQHPRAELVLREVVEKGAFPPVLTGLTNLLSAVVDRFGCVSDYAVATLANHVHTTPVVLDSIVSHYHYFPRIRTAAVGPADDHAEEDAAARTPVVYLCECAGCRRAGGLAVKAYMKAHGLRYHMTSWLGWCVNGPPAALVKRPGDPRVHAVLRVHPGDPRVCSEDGLASVDGACTGGVAGMTALPATRLARGGPPPASIIDPPAVFRTLPPYGDAAAQGALNSVTARVAALSAQEVLARLRASGLRGCGGAGFPAHVKWAGVQAAPPGSKRYLVVNADEGLPSTFKDYYLLAQPHGRALLLHGIGIAAHATGVSHCILYLRYEYKNLQAALEEAFDAYALQQPSLLCGWGGAPFRFQIVLGGGPYVCGEETALFESVEGHLPQARTDRSLFPNKTGLFGQPTLVHNVETLCWLPLVVAAEGGVERFATPPAPAPLGGPGGIKLLCVSGDVPSPLVGEWPLGVSLRTVLEEVCGPDQVPHIAAVEVGGTLEPLTLPSDFDLPLTLDANAIAAGKSLSAAGSVVVYRSLSVQEEDSMFRAKAKFCNIESCQLCAPCREGTRLVRNVLPRLADARVTAGSDAWAHVAALACTMEVASNCAHGKAAGRLSRTMMDRLAARQEKHK